MSLLDDIQRKALAELVAYVVQVFLVLDFELLDVKLNLVVLDVTGFRNRLACRGVLRVDIGVLKSRDGYRRLLIVVLSQINEPLVVACTTEF